MTLGRRLRQNRDHLRFNSAFELIRQRTSAAQQSKPQSDAGTKRSLEPLDYFRKCSCAERWAPVSSSNPERNAQNIKLTDNENGPYTSAKFNLGRARM